MAEDIAAVNARLDALNVALEQFGVFNQNASKSMGLFEKQKAKVITALKRSPIAGMVKTLAGYGKAVTNVTKITGLNTTMSKEQKAEHREGMTVMQKLAAATIAHGVAQKFSNKILKIANNRFTRLMVSAFSLVSIFLIVGFALAALSIAFDGANSPVLKMTEDLGPLHDAMQGLVLVISGEGDEGGLTTALDVLAAGFLAAGVAALFLGAKVGVVIGAAVIAAGAFRMMQNEFDNIYASILVAIGVFTTLIGIIMMVKAAFVALATGASVAAAIATGAMVAAVGLIIGGIGALVAYAMGAGEGIKGLLIGLLGALLVFVGAVILLPGVITAAIIAAVVFLIASIVRYWDEIKTIFSTAWEWLKNLAGLVFYGFISGISLLFGAIVGLITGAIAVVLGLIVGIFTALFDLGASFYNDVIKGGGSLIDWFISIPGTIKDGFINGFKSVFNAVVGIYNDFADLMVFDIPDWVPVVGGKEFKLPKIPLLAKGGIVNSPTLAMIGEDGPEAVVPLNRKNNPDGIGLGGGMTVNINVGGVTDRTDKKQLAREIGDLLRAEMTRGGRSHGNRRSSV